MSAIINTLTDLTYLEWTNSRHSSGTAGSFLKAYENKRGRKLYYKLSNYDVVNGICGHECVNEIVVDRLMDVLEIPHLSYTLVHANVSIRGKVYETYLCRSEDFKNPGDSKIALDVYYDMEHLNEESPLEFCIRYGWSDYVYDMLMVDFIIQNRDRHGANIEVLRNRKSKEVRLAPLFDQGLSLVLFTGSDEELKAIDPLTEKRIQSLVGSNNAYDNLFLIPKEKMRELPKFDNKVKEYVMNGLDEIMGNCWTETIWNFIKTRAEKYENLRNQR